jgi:hypothetical protein
MACAGEGKGGRASRALRCHRFHPSEGNSIGVKKHAGRQSPAGPWR